MYQVFRQHCCLIVHFISIINRTRQNRHRINIICLKELRHVYVKPAVISADTSVRQNTCLRDQRAGSHYRTKAIISQHCGQVFAHSRDEEKNKISTHKYQHQERCVEIVLTTITSAPVLLPCYTPSLTLWTTLPSIPPGSHLPSFSHQPHPPLVINTSRHTYKLTPRLPSLTSIP